MDSIKLPSDIKTTPNGDPVARENNTKKEKKKTKKNETSQNMVPADDDRPRKDGPGGE